MAGLVTAVVLGLGGCGGSSNDNASDDRSSTPSGSRHTSSSTTSPTTTTTTTTSSTPPEAPPDPPRVGDCRALTYTDIGLYANDDKPVDCTKTHTAYTFDVVTLPDDVAFEGVDIQNDAVQAAAADGCRKAFIAYIAGSAATRALARLTVTYFLPDQSGFDLGAHWVRCDVIALQSANSLGALPRDLKGILDDDSALVKYGVCARGTPGEPTTLLVMCTQDHDYRALVALRLGAADAAYIGENAAESRTSECEDLIKERLGVGGGFTYAWTYPSADDWADGQRFGYCWNQTEK
jgi:hypothetical protein